MKITIENKITIGEKRTIDDLAYQIKTAKDNKPIVFLGAGASFSGNIPLAEGIVKIILEDYKDKPAITRLSEEDKQNYYILMDALNPTERRKLFKKLIENAKINIAHIYLAQMVKLGYIDYVLTVNFDDLLLRACGLFNYSIPVYDISNVDSFTDANLQKQSLIYLHGKHYGEWLLNSRGELNKGKEIIPSLISKISGEQTWIVVGYGGNDEVFDALNKVSSFQNDLYWINYLDNPPCEKVKTSLIDEPTKNAYTISGYDADTFFLDLHSKLGIKTPDIVDKPFSFLKTMTDEITVPNYKTENDEHKKLYINLKERKSICDNWVNKAIKEFENDNSLEKLQQEIIDLIIKKDFKPEAANRFENEIKEQNYVKAKIQLSWYYGDWGIKLYKFAKMKGDEELYKESFVKYEKSIELNPKDDKSHYNLGTALYHLAKMKGDEELYKESMVKFEKSIELNPKNDSAYNNWGTALFDLAKLKGDEELYKESFVKYEKSIKLNPKDDLAFNNWGNALSSIAKMKGDEELYKESFTNFKKSIELNPKNDSTYNNWGAALSNLAKLKGDEKLYKESLSKYEKSIELNPKNDSTFYNWGSSLMELAKLNQDEKNWIRAEEILLKGVELGGKVYNLACFYGLRADKKKAMEYLEQALDKKEVSVKFVEDEDDDWDAFRKDEDFIKLIIKFKK